MIWLILLGVLVFMAAMVHFICVAEGRWILGPEIFFLVMAVGTYYATAWAAVDDGNAASPYPYFVGIGALAFVAGTLVARSTFGFSHRRELRRFRETPWQDDIQGARFHAVLLIGLVSVIITAGYFQILGFFVPTAALKSLLTSGPEAMVKTYNDLRRISSTGEYLALGYVAQFKNCLLPLVTLLLYFRARVRSSLLLNLLVGFFLLATGLAAVGTGARFGLAFLGASFLFIGVAPVMHPLRLSGRQLVVVLTLSLALLSVLTLMMGGRGGRTLDVPILWAPYEVVERVFVAPSVERYHVYELYLQYQEPQWGSATLRELHNVLPGRAPLTLSNRLHQMMYGSARGNVALDFWGTLWYELQWWGILLAFFHGFLLHAFYTWVLRGPKRLARVVVLLFAGIILGFATDLQVLVLRGFVTCFLLLACLNAASGLADLGRRRQETSGTELASGSGMP